MQSKEWVEFKKYYALLDKISPENLSNFQLFVVF